MMPAMPVFLIGNKYMHCNRIHIIRGCGHKTSAAFVLLEKEGRESFMAVFTGNNHKGKTQKERIKEITGQLEAGVTAVFEITKNN